MGSRGISDIDDGVPMRATLRPRNDTPLPFRSPAPAGWGVWDRFLRARPDSGFRQSSWWATFRATAGHRIFGAMVRHQGIVIGGGVVQRHRGGDRRGYYALPEGPVLPREPGRDREVFEAFLGMVRQHRLADSRTISHLRLAPRWEEIPAFLDAFDVRVAPPDPTMGPRHTFDVDLRGSETGILAQMHPEARVAIATARQGGVIVALDDTPRGIADFLALAEAGPHQDLPAPMAPEELGRLIPDLHSKGRGALLFAESRGERIAAGVLITFGIRATMLDPVGTSPRGGIAASLLLFEAMRLARLHGCESFDLHGIAPADVPGHPWEEATKFKASFGGARLDFIPALDLVFDEAAYARHLAELE